MIEASSMKTAASRPMRDIAAYRRLVTAAGLALVLGLAACSSTDEDKVDATPADVLYNQGLANMQSGKPTEAIKKFEDLDRLHPYSELSRKGILLQAYSAFEKGDYTSCIQAAKRFATIYPQSPEAAYALYLIAESYYKQIPEVSRDQELTQKALDAYAELLTKFPDSRFTADARQKQEAARDQLAGKEMEIGRFYLQKREYLAAINRFRVVVGKYQTTRHVEEALSRLVECYYALGVVPEAQTAAAVLGHNFPDSKWYKDSFTLLQTGGYAPQEDQGSWISKAFRGIKII
ncbi:MAG: outer membrane protein assembly factor BamD [Ancalomicrobiaceae bacterium]|nr:outer membrane protein assembly factor BamD [Ancalomicrobiaceae bacterium]